MNNKFCWNELLSHDVEKHKEFYSKLFGWEVVVKHENDGYIIFKKDGHEVAGLMKMPEGHDDVPSSWLSYIAVDDVDGMVKKSEELGGKTHLVPMDIPNVGRIAVISDPVNGMVGICKLECSEKKCCCKK